MITGGLMSSNDETWSTPQWLFDELDREFNFTIDVCASDSNAKCGRYYTEQDDCLSQSWKGEICFMNPPYGRKIGDFMRKAYKESLNGSTVVCLAPARTDTKWWWDTAMNVYPDGVRFIKGRLKFGNGKGSAPFPSAIIVFDGRQYETS